MESITEVVLETGPDGRARFTERERPFNSGSPAVRLTEPAAVREAQWRVSPVGFRSPVHVTTTPQWVVVLSGAMEIGLVSGEVRRFAAGEGFYSADTLPEGVTFDPAVHGHWSRQVGDAPLVTLFIR